MLDFLFSTVEMPMLDYLLILFIGCLYMGLFAWGFFDNFDEK